MKTEQGQLQIAYTYIDWRDEFKIYQIIDIHEIPVKVLK